MRWSNHGHRTGRPGRAEHHPGGGFLRHRGHRRGSGRVGRCSLRRVRGFADGPGRAHRNGWAGRSELPDRELSRLPGRGLRSPAHRAGATAGAEVRCRDDHHPRCCWCRGEWFRTNGPVCGRRHDRCAHGDPGNGCFLPSIGGAGAGRPGRARSLLRVGPLRGAVLCWPGRVHRRRRQFRRPGRRVLLEIRAHRDDVDPWAVAGRVDVLLPDPADRGHLQHQGAHQHRDRLRPRG